ncbi:MAG: hypothetical protein H7293_22595 [Candidatus Saccharibacteria bacterium]|nr:hypothetical protein [Rhodoferax sp.]
MTEEELTLQAEDWIREAIRSSQARARLTAKFGIRFINPRDDNPDYLEEPLKSKVEALLRRQGWFGWLPQAEYDFMSPEPK